MIPRRAPLVFALAATLVATSCSSGRSALDANDNEELSVVETESSVPGGSAPATSTTIPLADLPACPTDALADVDEADGPVEVVFWHGMTNELETALVEITDAYNASQSAVRVELQSQLGYDELMDTYIAASPSTRPTIAQLPEFALREFADSDTFVPAGACIESSGYETDPMIPRTLSAYQLDGVQWAMPFNVSNPVLVYNRSMFEAAGLDPDDPPVTLDELRAASQAIVDSGAAPYGLVVESGTDSGGGWFIEQWFGRVGEPYADNGNGRLARATEVLFDNELGTELLTFLQDMLTDGLAVDVGDNANETDALFKLADASEPGAMVITTSAALGTVFQTLGSGVIPGLTVDDIGVGPMPGPSEVPAVQVGGASLWVVDGKPDAQTAAAWDYITYLTSAEVQSQWAARTGYAPIREDAVELEPLATTYAEDQRIRVPYDQLVSGESDVTNNSPALGPLRQVRAELAGAVAAVFGGGDPSQALADAAAASNALIASYNERN